MKEELRNLRSLQNGNENRGQLFALLSQRCGLFHADNPRFHEQFQPVSAFFNLAQRIAAFCDELIRSLPTRSPLPSRLYRLCRSSPVAPFSFAPHAKRFSIISADGSPRPEQLLRTCACVVFGARKTCAQSEARKPSSDRVDPFLPSAFLLITSRCKR